VSAPSGYASFFQVLVITVAYAPVHWLGTKVDEILSKKTGLYLQLSKWKFGHSLAVALLMIGLVFLVEFSGSWSIAWTWLPTAFLASLEPFKSD